jgi:predicted ABC-type sugar transport system permease subunit
VKIRILLAIVSLVASILIGLALAGRGGGTARSVDRQVTIGLSLDTLKESRWQADRDMFVKRAGELGVLFGALIMASLLNGMTLMAVSPEAKYIARGAVLALAAWLDLRLGQGR